ncbi:MAG: tRNA pseudouridine(38-40) synthase TruA [Deltaproteobacteria bacterium HGW-Deltaproteobacteria-23]|nr:MAG: tRNA pseudouridine(38-40) synthase TruA [Deltaproteobacteria bacterium HGW-Deltaproteobacteria-23]
MHTIKLTIEYDGSAYSGWQFQPNGLAVQEVMEAALANLLGARVHLYSSGRTDAGVHARGMVASFATVLLLPLSAYTDGMNCLLPPDIAVISAEEVALDFNPRHDAHGKHYRYSIHTAPRRSPLSRLYAWHLREKLDLELMRQGAVLFVGEHDFAAFRTSGCAAKTTVRRIDSVEISTSGDLLHIDVIGSGFMRNMVRIMAGTLVEIGKGRMPPEHISRCLAEPGVKAGPTAPPHGLCLMEVYY